MQSQTTMHRDRRIRHQQSDVGDREAISPVDIERLSSKYSAISGNSNRSIGSESADSATELVLLQAGTKTRPGNKYGDLPLAFVSMVSCRFGIACRRAPEPGRIFSRIKRGAGFSYSVIPYRIGGRT
jgi:hypothetical protein